jgi:hypothetical protein
MTDPKDKAIAEQITFYSQWLPALAAGEYSVQVKPELKALIDDQQTTDVTDDQDVVREVFHVGAPRWALTGTEVYSCHPAPDQIGEFSETLPHIVFDRCTLPWERTIDSTDPTKPHDPWLALVLLTDSDFEFESTVEKQRVPPIVVRKLGELLRGTPGNVVCPKISLDPYDDEVNDICQTIDLPAKVFDAVVPHKQEVQYLAHVREVKTDNKETWSLLKEGRFSVVICNRFPETQAVAGAAKDWGIVNTMFLLSLEGWDEYLANRTKLQPGQSCRFVVLSSWRFTCQGRNDFKSLMTHLNKDDKDNRLLSLPPVNGSDGDALKYVNNAFQMGFSPVNHDLRNSDTTISWYRGPLAAMAYEKSMSYQDVSCADGALRYHSETGMFDASYAAAWQLGRLLALQDQAFAQALFGFRTSYQRWVRKTNTAALRAIDRRKLEDLQDKLRGHQKGSPHAGFDGIRDLYAKTLGDAGYLTTNGTQPALEEPAIPATVQNWLGEAMLLYGVPFSYLVPDEAMLPAESIRFFYLNPEWLNFLLQGACSVGRTSETDELADQFLRTCFFKVSEKLAIALRSNAKHEADVRRTEEGADAKPAVRPTVSDVVADTSPTLNWPLSGYLMRSAAVESWVGLEAMASSNGVPLQILRMDRLAPEILLCIYNGKVTEIELKQPPEAVHFGAATKADGYEKVGLRKIRGDIAVLGDPLPGDGTLVPIRGQRVVHVNELADAIKKRLGDQLASGDSLTSAEFAVQMIESPAKVIFTEAK